MEKNISERVRVKDKIAAIELSYGKGYIFLYGFKPQHRGQAHGTYRYQCG